MKSACYMRKTKFISERIVGIFFVLCLILALQADMMQFSPTNEYLSLCVMIQPAFLSATVNKS